MARKKKRRPQASPMTVRHISTDSPFEEQIGYSRAVVADGWVFVAGTTGYEYASMAMPESIEEQTTNALATISKVLEQAGSSLNDVVRVTYIVPNANEWPACWPITSKAFALSKPAATMISAQLQNSEMKIEIEVTARLTA
ncbi:MAG: enamine deaminase RidA (YjgF/YER057c/UK114 family) [Yoonia sp.]|jgi:enamine deaminase RidA (YjgF/YER057c/UK114 family)